MKDRLAHQWNISPKEAIAVQKELRDKVSIQPFGKPIRYVAGADVSFNKFSPDVYAGIVILSYPDLQIRGYSCVKEEVNFPYIPGLLSFREIPPLLSAWNNLKMKPDVTMVDGHGIAHPRRLGIAAHFGLASGAATLGCAKKILFGSFAMPAETKGSHRPIIDPKTGEKIGEVLRTKDGVSPVFISPGNDMDVVSAHTIALSCAWKHRLPEPTRQAHLLVNRFRRGELGPGSEISNFPPFSHK